MKDYYCFDIAFPNIVFDEFMSNSEKVKSIHHAHIYSKENEIEVRVLFESNTYFGRKLSLWASSINWKTFGTFIEASNVNQNERLEKIDFGGASLVGIKNGTNQYEGNLQYVIINIDVVKFYWQPSQENTNTAEFYLNETGFKAVKSFYTPLMETEDGEFSFKRMNGTDVFYTIDKGKFRPEFNFCVRDDKSASEAKIIKEPKIQFIYTENVTEEEALKYGDIIRIITSFYFHSNVNYSLIRIHLEKNTITIKRVNKPNHMEPTGNFWGFKNFWDLHKFLSSDWQKTTFENHGKLPKVVEMFIQAISVYNSSRYLIFYNIIEIIKGGDKEIKSEFTQLLNDDERKVKFDEALEVLLKTIGSEEHTDFKNKWQGVSSKLKYKPMKSPMEEFLRKSKLDPDTFPIKLKKIIELRDDFTHGSTNIVQSEELDKANKFLYRISGILILQLMGVQEWELDLKLD